MTDLVTRPAVTTDVPELAIGFYTRRGWVPTSMTRPGPQGFEYVTYRLDQR